MGEELNAAFESGGRGMMGLPMEPREVTPEELEEEFPTPDVLEKWHRGEEAEWPPEGPPCSDQIDDRAGAAKEIPKDVSPNLGGLIPVQLVDEASEVPHEHMRVAACEIGGVGVLQLEEIPVLSVGDAGQQRQPEQEDQATAAFG